MATWSTFLQASADMEYASGLLDAESRFEVLADRVEREPAHILVQKLSELLDAQAPPRPAPAVSACPRERCR